MLAIPKSGKVSALDVLQAHPQMPACHPCPPGLNWPAQEVQLLEKAVVSKLDSGFHGLVTMGCDTNFSSPVTKAQADPRPAKCPLLLY